MTMNSPQTAQPASGEPVPSWWPPLQTLLAQTPALLGELQRAASPDLAGEILAAAAAAQGLVIAPAELARYLRTLTPAASPEALSDEVLDGVAGGIRSSNDTLVAEKRYSILMVRRGGDCSQSGSKPWLQPDFDWGNNVV